jgi:hypothetical protein
MFEKFRRKAKSQTLNPEEDKRVVQKLNSQKAAPNVVEPEKKPEPYMVIDDAADALDQGPILSTSEMIDFAEGVDSDTETITE